MVHLYCHISDIKDTSRGNAYHNKRFKAEAEKRGLDIDYDKRIGHSITQPSKELKSFISKQGWKNKLNLHRRGGVGENDPTGRTRRTSHTRKYVCSSCGNSVRATKDVNIACLDCQVRMVILEEQKEAC
jgi:DNA-directed RNA polymerase subunit RPC12/RpoP